LKKRGDFFNKKTGFEEKNEKKGEKRKKWPVLLKKKHRFFKF